MDYKQCTKCGVSGIIADYSFMNYEKSLYCVFCGSPLKEVKETTYSVGVFYDNDRITLKEFKDKKKAERYYKEIQKDTQYFDTDGFFFFEN